MDRAKRERETKGRQQNGRRRWVEGGGERPASRASTTPGETAPPLYHGLERSTAGRLSEERWRKRGEGRKNGLQKVKVMDGGSHGARDLGVG